MGRTTAGAEHDGPGPSPHRSVSEDDDSKDRGPLGLAPQVWALVLVVSAALVAVTASGPASGIALPTLAQDLGLTQNQITLVGTIGTVVTASVLLPLGLAADRYGRRRFLVAGLLVFAGSEVVTAAVSSPGVIIAARALVALGIACVLPTSLAVLVAAFPREQRAKAVAIWAAVSSASASAAGLVSGALATALSWRAVPLAVAVLALAIVVPVAKVVRDGPQRTDKPDVLGALLALVGVAGFILGITGAGAMGLAAFQTWGSLGVGVTALAAFAVWELRTPTPMLPVRAFADPVLRSGSLLLVLVAGAFGAFTFLATQYLQFGRELNPLQAALAFAVTDVGLLAASPLLPHALRRVGVRWVGTTGASVVAAALIALAVVSDLPQTWPVLVCLGALGAGFALAITPATTLIVSALPPERLNTASALNYVNRDVGTAVGTAVVGAVLLAVYSASLGTGLADAGAALDVEQSARASTGIGEAATLAQELGADGQAVLSAARAAFLDGFRVAAVSAGALAGLAALLCALTAPKSVRSIAEIPAVPVGEGSGGS